MRHLRRTLLLAATIGVAAGVGLPAQSASALPGVCGEGHVGTNGWPGDSCTIDQCSGVFAGPIIAEPTARLFVCFEF